MIERIYTISADSMSKRVKRASESHEQIVSRSVSVNSSICTIHSVVMLGPDFVHLLCHGMMYRKTYKQVLSYDSSLHMHGGHTEEWTVVMCYLHIQAIHGLRLYHVWDSTATFFPPSPMTPPTHTLNSNLHMPSLCSNPIVPETATR